MEGSLTPLGSACLLALLSIRAIAPVPAEPVSAAWASSLVSGSGDSGFSAVAVDGSGNLYAAGALRGRGTYGFGGGVAVAARGGDSRCLLVRYSAAGEAKWARSCSARSGAALFWGVAVDGAGDVYAAGYVSGRARFAFGDGVSVSGVSKFENAILVKYDPDGAALWARTLVSGSDGAYFESVAVDGAGGVYAAGWMSGRGRHDFGNGVAAQGTGIDGNALLVKYDPSGRAEWARTLTEGADNAEFYSVAADRSGSVYAAGSIGSGDYGFGDGVVAQGASAGGYSNLVLVKYSPLGSARWAATAGGDLAGESRYTAVLVDGSGAVYAAGEITGIGPYLLGPGVAARGVVPFSEGFVLAKYSPGGRALWARTLASGFVEESLYSAVALDPRGGVVAAGSAVGGGTFVIGAGTTVRASSPYRNALIVGYDAAGGPRWAGSETSGYSANFDALASDGKGGVVAAGYAYGRERYGFGAGVRGSSPGANALIVGYHR